MVTFTHKNWAVFFPPSYSCTFICSLKKKDVESNSVEKATNDTYLVSNWMKMEEVVFFK